MKTGKPIYKPNKRTGQWGVSKLESTKAFSIPEHRKDNQQSATNNL